MGEVTSIYKYTRICDLSLANLEQNKLYTQSPNMFNDPYEFIFRFEVPDEQMVDFLKHMYGDGYKKFLAMESPKNGILKWSRDYYFAEHRNALGVSCFSDDSRNELLWAHYGDSHKGMCLEFDRTKEPFNQSMPVQYVKEVPVITYEDLTGSFETTAEKFFAIFLTKPDLWSYEREWRMLTDANSYIPYDADSILSITFGFFCPGEKKQEVIEKTAHLSIPYYEIVRAKDFYAIERLSIDLDTLTKNKKETRL